MTTAAKRTFGNKLFLAAAPTAPTVALTEILGFTPPAITRDTFDVTTHDSAGGAEEYMTEGTYNPGEYKVQNHYIAGSADDLLLRQAAVTGSLMNIKGVVKGASGDVNKTASGYITDYTIEDMPVKGKQASSFTLKITGAETQAAAA